jgi:PIN domain nuclease of toxin-antitoxin system
MRLLLDTHIYLWWVQGCRHLSSSTRSLISNAEEVYISSVSIWEIAIKTKLGKLTADIEELIDAIEDSGFLELPLLAKHVTELQHLPNLHKDPFDRILIAQTISEPLKFLTIDATLKDYSELVTMVS